MPRTKRFPRTVRLSEHSIQQLDWLRDALDQHNTQVVEQALDLLYQTTWIKLVCDDKETVSK